MLFKCLNWSRGGGRALVGSALMLVLCVLGTLSGCEAMVSEGSSATPEQLRVTATTGMVADTARRVGGDWVAVEALMGPGVDPHLYKASQSDLHKLSNADLILYNGLHLEGRMVDILAKMDRWTPTLAVAETLPEDKLRSLEDYPGNQDPHIWMDLSLWRYAVEAIRDRFIALAPEHADDFTANAAIMLEEIAALDAETREAIASIPRESRVLITAHDAFGYFGAAYDIEVMGLQGISTASEYGLQDMNRLVNLIVERDIKAIFVETSISTRGMEALVAGVRAQGEDLRIGGSLYGDALGDADTPEGTYLGMFRHNVETIVGALR